MERKVIIIDLIKIGNNVIFNKNIISHITKSEQTSRLCVYLSNGKYEYICFKDFEERDTAFNNIILKSEQI